MIPNFMNIFIAWVYARGQRVQVGFLCLGVCIVHQALFFTVHIQINGKNRFHIMEILYIHIIICRFTY